MTILGKDPFYAKFVSDHRELRDHVTAIENQLNRGQENAASPARLLQMLNELLVHIKRHFDEEEQGGILEEATCRLPRLSSQVACVERQHQPLLEQLAAVVRQAGSCGPTARQWESVADAFSRFAFALRVHEAAENRVADEAFGNGGSTY